MSAKTKTLSTVSLLLSIAVLVFCYCNFEGQISEPYRMTSKVSFYGILGGPVAIASLAMVLGMMAWLSLKVLAELSDDSPAES